MYFRKQSLLERKNSLRLKKDKIVYIILVLILFLSGVCFENNKADSKFLCSPVECSDSNIKSDIFTNLDIQVCTAEMLGAGRISSVQQFSCSHICKNRELKIFPDYLLLSYLSITEGKFFTSSEITQVYSKCLDELIMNYIHKSDGKKRI